MLDPSPGITASGTFALHGIIEKKEALLALFL